MKKTGFCSEVAHNLMGETNNKQLRCTVLNVLMLVWQTYYYWRMKGGRRTLECHEPYMCYYNSTEPKDKTKHWEDLLSSFYNVTVTRILYKRKSFSRLGKFFVFMCTDFMSTKSWRVGAVAVIPALKSKSNLTRLSKRINVTFNYIMKHLVLSTISIN